MARLKGTNVLNTTIRGHQHEDGYVLLGPDGYTVENITSFSIDTVFSTSPQTPAFVRTATGLWTATLAEAYACNLRYFNVVPVFYTGSSPGLLFFKQLSDNVGSVGTTNNAGANPQVINFGFVNSSGTLTDMPPYSGFRYEIGLQVSTAYYVESY